MVNRLSYFQRNLVLACVFAFTIVLTFYLYMASYEPVPLLEEYFLLDFMKSRATSMMGFLTSTVDWTGPLPDDSWGMFASAITAVLSNVTNQSLGVLRTVSVLTHASNCLLMFYVIRDALADPEREHFAISTWLAGAASLIFALYPLAPEAVSFIGGLAYEFGTTFFLTSFYLYLKGKREHNWTILGLSWISFLFAVLSDNSLWSSGFIMVALELSISFIGTPPAATNRRVPTEDEVFEDAVDRMLEESKLHQVDSENERSGKISDTESGVSSNEDGYQAGNKPRLYDDEDNPDSLFDTLVPCLPLIVLGVVLSIRALPSTGNEQLPGDMIGGFSDWGRVFRHLFFPINQAITSDPFKAYMEMGCLYAVPVLVSLIALIRSRQFRRNAAVLFAWLIVIIVPHLHTAICDSFLLGSRLAYSALVPTAAMIALVLFSPAYAIAGLPLASNGKSKMACMVFAAIFLASLSILNFNRTRQQAIAYSLGAMRLERLSEAVKKHANSNKMPYVLVRDIPGDVGVSEKISPSKMIIFDSEKKLLRAADVPGGFLKDALRQGRYSEGTMRWDDPNNTLKQIVFASNSVALKRLSAAEMNQRILPLKEDGGTVRFESTTDEILIESKSKDAPSININASGISQLGDDFIYVDCKIDMPNPESDDQMRLYWLTAEQPKIDTSRIAYCSITANDGLYHRYFIPLRSSAWTTNGPIQQIGFGFPVASRVVLKEIGLDSPTNRLAKLTYLKTDKLPESQVSHTPIHTRLICNYPNLPELGLLLIDRKSEEVTLRYDTSMIENSHGALMEISRGDSSFAQPNSDKAAVGTLKTINLENTSGELKFPAKYFKNDGVYSVRVFGASKVGKLLGNASDEINFLIYTSPPGS